MKRSILGVVIILAMMMGALPAQAHHRNDNTVTYTYYNIKTSVTWSGEFHCRTSDGYRVAAQSKTYGFGFADSTGAKTIELWSFGARETAGWGNTEFDHYTHGRRTTTPFSIVQQVRWQHGSVWTGGDMQISLFCTRSPGGVYSYSW